MTMASTALVITNATRNTNGATSEEDDTETWKALASLPSGDNNQIKPRLESLAGRFHDDIDSPTDVAFWQDLCDQAASKGFRMSDSDFQTPSNAMGSNQRSSVPTLFQSDSGKKHILATSALLSLSEQASMKLTMRVLRSLQDDELQFQSLIGTRELVLKIVYHHFDERVSRLAVLTECLRLEQDVDALQRESTVEFLNSIDGTYQDEGRKRGIFRRLLTIACKEETPPNRDQLQPSKDLRASTPNTLHHSLTSRLGDAVWEQFVAECNDANRTRAMRERTEAMEALLVLLYSRIQGGVQRSDYAVLLIAFQSSYSFFTACTDGSRLCQLAGLICSECMGLWRAFDPQGRDVASWVTTHPILLGAIPRGNASNAEQELECLKLLLVEFAENVADRNMKQLSVAGYSNGAKELQVEAPEALAVLSFGLLLNLAFRSMSASGANSQQDWKSLHKMGLELAQIANDKCGAFDYLYAVMGRLVTDTSEVPRAAVNDGPYDWQFPTKPSNLLLLEDDPRKGLGDTTVYASIGREILEASIAAFDGILSLNQGSARACDNIGMLSNLAAVIFRNNPVLCNPFWGEWSAYTTGEKLASSSPICHLMESAHSLAVAGLDAAKGAHNEIAASEILLPSVAPIFSLLASLCSESDAVESTVPKLPKSLIRTTLLHCKSKATQEQLKSRISVLQSISTLTRIGDSKSCRDQLRRALEDPSSSETDGARVLSQIIDSSNDVEIVHHVMRIMANLLEHAPQRWPLQLARTFVGVEENSSRLARLLTQENTATHSATLLLSSLVEHLNAVLFCKSFNEHESVDFLRGIANGVLAAGTALASSLSPVRRVAAFDSAHVILQTYSNMLQSLGTAIAIHKLPNVRSMALEVRDKLLSFLASSTGLGQAIAYYATAPVSLSLVIRLQKFLDDERVLRTISEDGDEGQGLNKKYGAWVSATSAKRDTSGTDLLTKAKTYLCSLACSSETLDLDLRGIHARGWTYGSDELAPLRAASAAVRLLATWAGHAEDIALRQGYNRESQRADLDDSGKKVLAALSPQVLLSSLTCSPLPIRTSGTLSSAWAAASLANFDLLLRYVSNDNNTYSENMLEMPSAAALDLFYACISHVHSSFSSEEAAECSLFRTLHRSSTFPTVLLNSASLASTVLSSEPLDKNGKTAVACGLLALRIVTGCIRAIPSFGKTLLDLDPSSICMAFVNPISRVLPMLESCQGDYSAILQEEDCISQLRVAGGCLSVIHALRISHSVPQGSIQAARSRLATIVDFEAILNDLLLLITEHASAVDVAKSFTVHGLGGSCALVTFVSLAFDILAAEMSLSMHNEDKGTGTRNAFQDIFEGNYDRLVPMAQCFSSFDSCSIVAKATARFQHSVGEGWSKAELATPKSLLMSLPSTSASIFATDFYSLQNAFDMASVNRWLESLGTNDDDCCDSVGVLCLSHQLVWGELRLLSSWRLFSETLPFFMKYNPLLITHNDAALTTAWYMSSETMLALVRETLQELNRNTGAVEIGQVEISADFLWEEIDQMTSTLSGMLLFFSDLCTRMEESTPQDSDLKTVLDTLDMLAQTSERLFTVTMSRRSGTAPSEQQMQSCCKLEQQLFASACVLIGLVEAREDGAPKSLRWQRDDIYNDLASTCGKVLNVLVFLASDESQAMQPEDEDIAQKKRQYREAFLTTSSLLTLLVSRTSYALDESNAYFKKVSNTIRGHGMLESLLGQAVLASAAAAALRSSLSESIKSSRSEEAETVSVVKSVLTLLNSIAGAGDPDMLALLADSRLVQLVSNNPLFAYAGNGRAIGDSSTTPRRGYIPSGEPGSVQRMESSRNASAMAFYSGHDDPIHDVWLTSMMVLRACLRSSARLQTEEMKGRFLGVALEFLASYHDQVLSCLKECSAVLSDSKSSFFTLNSLNEASTILGLVSELCSRTNRNSFMVSQKSLYEEFIRWSTHVVVSISKFLGASATARELFLALSQYDTADQLGHGDYATLLKSRHPAFAGGVQNAKHEATRYSHFASSCCACVTRKDFEAASVVPIHFQHLSQEKAHDSALERNCRVSVTSIFVLELEQVAAECLSQAISVIWATHPSASSFVMLSEREASQIDTMSYVQTGTIIAFRPAQKRPFIVGGETEDSDSIKFGRVFFSDTVKRAWEVEVIDRFTSHAAPDKQRVAVPVAYLAGIEDVSKRKCVASYRASPDSAAELENMQQVLSLGHLILALRWCHQDSTKTTTNDPGPSPRARPFIQRLAEQITALLGSELSLHQEVGSRETIQKAEQAKLDAQILELFGDLLEIREIGSEAVSGSFFNPVAQEGRLKSVLCESSWLTIQPQVQDHTLRAWSDIREREKKRKEGHNGHADGSWYGSIRRIGHKSPFRGLG